MTGFNDSLMQDLKIDSDLQRINEEVAKLINPQEKSNDH